MRKKLEAFRQEAEARMKSFSRRVTKLPEYVQSQVAKEFEGLEGPIERAYWGGRVESFFRLMGRLEGVVRDAEKRGKPSWMHPVQGGMFETQEWFVSSEEKASGLLKLGVSRGAIWTEEELRMLIGVKADRDLLNCVHQVKMVFGGAVVSVEDSNTGFAERSTERTSIDEDLANGGGQLWDKKTPTQIQNKIT